MSNRLTVLSTTTPQNGDETPLRCSPIPEGSRILLLLPPFYTPYTPPLGISVMKSYLQQRGYRVKCLDLNVVPHIWVAHHKYFEILQRSDGLTPQHGYTNLWYILQAHMLAHLNDLDSEGCKRILARILPVYDLKPDPGIINGLVPVVNQLFRDIDQFFFKEVDLSSLAVVGTSTYSTSLAPSLHILKQVKEANPDVMTVIGGGVFADDLASGSDNLETLLREYPYVDHIVMGEGEVLFRSLLEGTLRHKRVVTRDDIPTPTLNMKDVRMPDYTDFNIGNYLHLCIEGGRSCPFQCKFCSETVQWGNYRKKPPGVLADQMIHLAAIHSNKTYFMGDSLMNPYIEDLSKTLLDRHSGVLYDGYLRADKIATDRARTRRWAKSGCVRARLGIESASPRVLKAMQKETTPEGISRVIKSLASAGIRVTTLWIVGFPGETEEDFQQTLDFIREHHRFIYELDVHYYYYYPYGQVWSRLHKCLPLYSPEVVEHVKFQQWEIEECDPPRPVKFERLRRINDLATEMGIPNLHTLNARYAAEERWQLLFPLATEFFEGTLVSRAPYSASGTPFINPRPADPETAGHTPVALSYAVRVAKQIDEGIMRRAASVLIGYNEMLQMTVENRSLIPEPVPGDVASRVVTMIDPCNVGDLGDLIDTARRISDGMSPRAGDSIRIAIANSADSALLMISAHCSVSDGRSVALFLEDLFRAYEQIASDRPVTLRQPALTFAEYAEKLALAKVVQPDAPDTCRERESTPWKRRDLFVDSDLVRRFTPKLRRQSGLSFTEFILAGIGLALAEAEPNRSVALDVRADLRIAHPELEFTAGPLHATCRINFDREKCRTALDAARHAQKELRQTFARDWKGSGASAAVNLEYLTSEPWVGGDEWVPQGFVPDWTPSATGPLQLVGFLDRGRVSFVIYFAEGNEALVERMCAAMSSQHDSVWDRLIADIQARTAEVNDTSRRPRFSRPRRRPFTADDLVELGGLSSNGKPFPLVARSRFPELDPIDWAAANRERIEKLLVEHGAILFRGFHLPTPDHFRLLATTLANELVEFSERAAPRVEVAPRVYTSTEYPAEYPIPLHHENAFAYRWPLKLFLYSQIPAAKGGETPIADDQRFFEMLDPGIRELFRAKRVMYVRNYGRGVDLTWQEVFQTTDRGVVEDYCRKGGLHYEWLGGDGLRTARISPAIIKHPRTGNDVWFNHAHLFHISNLEPKLRESFSHEFSEEDLPRNTYYGDGSPIETSVLDHIRETYRRAAVRFLWQAQDVLLVDNMSVAHGREPFVGERKTLVIMADWSSDVPSTTARQAPPA